MHWYDALEELTVGTAYAAAILLVMLYALALLTRRVRLLQSNLEGLQTEVRMLGEALQTVTHREPTRARESIDSVLGGERGETVAAAESAAVVPSASADSPVSAVLSAVSADFPVSAVSPASPVSAVSPASPVSAVSPVKQD